MENRFEFCSVLVVDDHAPSRALVARALNDLGVGQVRTVPNPAAALEHLEHSRLGIFSSAIPPVDLLITEWDMEPFGGQLLLKWLRRSKASPNPFMRTAVMSGALNAEKVEQARAAGVNGVFVKPFTLNNLSSHVLKVLKANPVFVRSATYFGPDRRRQMAESLLRERRRIKESYAEVLGAGKNRAVGAFNLPHDMKTILDGQDRGTIDTSARELARDMLRPWAEDYADWIALEVKRLRLGFAAAAANQTRRAQFAAAMHGLTLRLEHEAEPFDYPLLAAFGHTLRVAMEISARNWEETHDILDTAIGGIEAVIGDRITGRGGAIGRALEDSLKEMDVKLHRLKPVPASHRKGVTFQKLRAG